MTRRERECVAELKFEEYSYEMKEQLDQPTPITPERPEVIVVPLSPARPLQRISKLEKTIASMFIVALVGVGLLMIQLRTSITQVEQEISLIQGEVVVDSADVLRLEQEKSELSKSDRIREIAEENGLAIQSENLRKVK